MKKLISVTVMYELGSGGNTDVYAVERIPWPFVWWKKYTSERWHAVIPVSYPLLPPTLADIDSDGLKEILVGLDNGTLIAYDVASNGKSASEKWRYKFEERVPDGGGTAIARHGGGTVVTDVDLVFIQVRKHLSAVLALPTLRAILRAAVVVAEAVADLFSMQQIRLRKKRLLESSCLLQRNLTLVNRRM